MEFQLKGVITEKIFIEMQNFRRRKLNFIRIALFNLIVILLFSAIVLGEQIFLNRLILGVIYFIFLLLGNLLLAFLINVGDKRIFKRAYRSDKAVNLERLIRIDESVFEQKTAIGQVRFGLDYVYRVEYGHHAIYLCESISKVYILQREWLVEGE